MMKASKPLIIVRNRIGKASGMGMMIKPKRIAPSSAMMPKPAKTAMKADMLCLTISASLLKSKRGKKRLSQARKSK